jgi:hypothetical protein
VAHPIAGSPRRYVVLLTPTSGVIADGAPGTHSEPQVAVVLQRAPTSRTPSHRPSDAATKAAVSPAAPVPNTSISACSMSLSGVSTMAYRPVVTPMPVFVHVCAPGSNTTCSARAHCRSCRWRCR